MLNRQADYQANAKCYKQKNMAEHIVLNAEVSAIGICHHKAIFRIALARQIEPC